MGVQLWDAEDFLDADIAVVATIPMVMENFQMRSKISTNLAGLDLKGKLYGVVGSGDTFYG